MYVVGVGAQGTYSALIIFFLYTLYYLSMVTHTDSNCLEEEKEEGARLGEKQPCGGSWKW
jgi:hypothetical protein